MTVSVTSGRDRHGHLKLELTLLCALAHMRKPVDF